MFMFSRDTDKHQNRMAAELLEGEIYKSKYKYSGDDDDQYWS